MQNPGTYPHQLKEIVGREITVRVKLNDDNILLNSTAFYATDAYDSNSASSSRSATTVSNTENSNFGDVSISTLKLIVVTCLSNLHL